MQSTPLYGYKYIIYLLNSFSETSLQKVKRKPDFRASQSLSWSAIFLEISCACAVITSGSKPISFLHTIAINSGALRVTTNRSRMWA